jgi:hypothetical protein
MSPSDLRVRRIRSQLPAAPEASPAGWVDALGYGDPFRYFDGSRRNDRVATARATSRA